MPTRAVTPLRVRRFVALLASLALVLVSAPAVLAGAGDPTAINVSMTGPLSVTASGTWSWHEMATETPPSYVGYAIDWGDVNSGNEVPIPGGGTFHIGDGTPATNVVQVATDRGTTGSWGPTTHTYAMAGTYSVCVILYDLGSTQPFATTGFHSLQAGGTGRNTDNSVEQNHDIASNCAAITVSQAIAATSSPSAVAAAVPGSVTPPSQSQGQGGSLASNIIPGVALASLLLLALLVALVARASRSGSH